MQSVVNALVHQRRDEHSHVDEGMWAVHVTYVTCQCVGVMRKKYNGSLTAH